MPGVSDDVGYMPGFVAHYLGAAIGKGGNGNGPEPLAGSTLMWFFCEAHMELMCNHWGV